MAVGSAIAADARFKPEISRAGADDSDWVVTIGGTATLEPSYLGANRFHVSGLPTVSLRRAEEAYDFSAPEDGLDYTLFGDKIFQIGPVANLRGGRMVSSDGRLRGLKKFPDTVDAGVFANYWPVPGVLRIRLEVREGLRPDDGIVADLNTDVVGHFSAFTLSGGPRISFGDGSANKLELGVSPAESVRNGLLPPFKAHAGIRSAGYGAAVSYDWTPVWRTTLFHRFDRLVGAAAGSPIPQRLGSRDQFTFGLGLTYSFRTKLDVF